MNCSVLTSTLKPLMHSSLSMVPPEKPSPRPLSLPTGRPRLAISGVSTSEVLSPTPPVECLSTTTVPAGRSLCGSSCWPEPAMASVSAVASASVIP